MPIRSSISSKPKAPPANVSIEPPDPRCWEGLKVKPCPGPGYVGCSDCRGYGQWNSTLNWLGKGTTRVSLCHTCEATGYVQPDACKHVWVFRKYVDFRMTERLEQCSKCLTCRSIDSS